MGGFSSVPSTIVGNAGSALSSTVTADFPNALYYAHNLPSGLAINSSTGEISGTPQVGGTHVLSVVATGGTNESQKEHLPTLPTPHQLQLQNLVHPPPMFSHHLPFSLGD